MTTDVLDDVADVDIDSRGRFKYILVRVYRAGDQAGGKYIVRGYLRCGYHMDILDEIEPDLERLGLKCDCPGGGRIDHDPSNKKIKVFGYSTGFGRPDHSISVEVLKKKYPDYEITWSNEGY